MLNFDFALIKKSLVFGVSFLKNQVLDIKVPDLLVNVNLDLSQSSALQLSLTAVKCQQKERGRGFYDGSSSFYFQSVNSEP